MSKKLCAVLILCMSAMSLAGCSWLRATGPCFGVGCPSSTEGRSGQYKPGEAPKAQNAAAPAPTQSAAAPTQSASAQPAAAQVPAQSAPAPSSAQPAAAQPSTTASTPAQATSAQPAPTQEANAEAKPSLLHSVGEFFAHLIPHHNSGAGSGAGN
jgi:hypothetical protein